MSERMSARRLANERDLTLLDIRTAEERETLG